MLALHDDQKEFTSQCREKLTNLRKVLITVLIQSLNLRVFVELKASGEVDFSELFRSLEKDRSFPKKVDKPSDLIQRLVALTLQEM